MYIYVKFGFPKIKLIDNNWLLTLNFPWQYIVVYRVIIIFHYFFVMNII